MDSKITVNKTTIRTISIIVFCGIFFAIIRSYFGDYLFHSYPKNTFLFIPEDRFADFYNMVLICSQNNPYFNAEPFASNYFPFANLVFYILSLMKQKLILGFCFMSFFLMLYSFLIYGLIGSKVKKYYLELLIVFFFSYPIFFNIDRLNIELYNFLLCAFWLYFRQKKKTFLSLLLLSISISLKLYTGVFLILYLKEKKYKELFLAGIITLSLSFAALLTFKGGVIANTKQMLVCFKNFTDTYTTSTTGLHHNLSLFGLIKIAGTVLIRVFTGTKVGLDSLNVILPYYSIFCLAFFAVIAVIILKSELSLWMNLFLLTSVLLLLPHVSYDYKLIFIYLPLLCFLQENEMSRYHKFFAIGFGLLLIPHNYFYLFSDISVSVFIYPAIVLGMVLVIIKEANGRSKYYNSRLRGISKFGSINS